MTAAQPDDSNAMPGGEKPRSEADAELEREIRAGRQFSLADAIGRLAGPGMMKGVSPIARKEQAETEIELFLRSNLADAEDQLGVALIQRIRGTQLQLNDYDQPLVILASQVPRILESSHQLKELVNDADIEWGRVFGERPYFQKEGSPPSPEDPFTLESVRASLTRLLEKLNAGVA